MVAVDSSLIGGCAPDHPVEIATKISREIAAAHAGDVDLRSRFPSETFDALRRAKLLSAAVPIELGGRGCDFAELAEICTILAQGCASSAMIFAMHSVQVVSIVNHRRGVAAVDDYLRTIVEEERLIASATSEVGIEGDLRRSIAFVERALDDRFCFEKAASASSYCEHADDLLLSLRRDSASAASDQVLALVMRGEFELADVGSWNALGMRGTCSPPARISGRGAAWQILPDSFRDIVSATMVPASHILWAAVWLGIAVDAHDRARRFLQIKSRKEPDGVAIGSNRLGALSRAVRTMRSQLDASIRATLECDRPFDPESTSQPGAVLAINDLKLSLSEGVVEVVHQAVQIVGITAYRNEGEFSLARHLRDAYSAPLMINNDRIRATNADLLLVHKGS
ncbi:MAG: acyl-CoA/acyl-ACP dehydrogenase [bacterium]|nr:acyl-CoA/acyl-ACP dehydrogenase [bacterium]